MAFSDFRPIKQAAYQRVEQMPNARRLMLLHAAIPSAISLVLTVLSYLLSLKIEDTGGLGGLGMRSLLESMQSMLQVLSSVFSLFWAYGLYRIVMHWSRGQRSWDSDLLAGFRHFGPILRTGLLQILLYTGVVILAFQLSAFLFSMTPLASDLVALAQQIVEDLNFMPTDQQIMETTRAYLPFLLITLAVLILPVFYRLRMTEFVLMDAPEKGAMHAMRASAKLMRGNCFKLLKLDLQFWWYYVLEVLVACLFYGDWVLELLGVDLGFSAPVMFFIACVVGLSAQVGLHVWRKNHVMTAYAMVYDALLPRENESATEI